MRALLLAAALLLSAPAWAQSETGGDAYAGTLKRVHDRGSVAIGYREAAFPFSYMIGGRPIGYTIDLCLGVVAELERAVDRPLRVEYVPIAADARLDAVASGRVDLECSSTTSNAERQKRTAFSPIIFVAGTKLLVRRDSPVRSFRDLAGRTVAVTSGTTNEQAIRRLDERNHLGTRIVTAPDHDRAFAMLADGRADAYASDDVLLYGLIAQKHAAADMMVVGDFLSYEPYGIMFAKDDPSMTAAVQRAFETMARDRDLAEYYQRWFVRATPGGEVMNVPMSAQLVGVFQLLGSGDLSGAD
jgi:glutamate/aspartate transport system substrate-binding protein